MAEKDLLNNRDDDEDAQKDKYLTFHLAAEDYGVEIRYVTEIIGIQKITEVREVVDIPAAQVEPPPATGSGTGSRYIQGMGKIDDEVKIILNVGQLFYEEELGQLDKVA